MPPSRPFLDRRRRSSHAIFSPAKPGVYGIPARPVTFAPNVTPVSFTETEDAEDDAGDPLASIALAASDAAAGPNVKALSAKLFPSSGAETVPQMPQTRKRCPPGKRRSQGYIPRPPNAFMLFRADFVKQRHVPGSVETNHVSLSKIIGEYWRQLPLEQKRVWEVRAKQEKAAHKAMFPDYRFRPVHNKHKRKAGSPESKSERDDSSRNDDRQSSMTADERRAEEVAQLLLEGKEGEDLAKAVRELDIRHRENDLNLGAALGLDPDSVFDYNVDSDSRSPSFDPPPPRGYNPDGSHVVQNPINVAPTIHMPTTVHPPFGIDFSTQNAIDMLFPSSSNAIAYPRRPSSVPLPLPNAEWFANPNPFLPSAAATGGMPLLAVPPFAPDDQHEGHQEFNNPDPFSWQANQTAQQRMSFQFSSTPFPPHQLGQGISSAPAQSQNLLQEQQFHSHAPIQPDSQGLFHPQPQIFGMQTTSRSSLERRASSAGPFFRRSWTMPAPFSNNMDPTYSMSSGFNMGMGTMPVEKDHNPLPDVDPAAAGLFADFSFGNSANCISSQLGSGGHSRTLSAASHTAIDPTDAFGAAVSGGTGMVAPIDISIPVPPLVHGQSQSSASTDGSWSSVAPPSHQNQYHMPTGVYTPPEAVPPTIQVYGQDQTYSVDGHNMISNGMYSVDNAVDMNHNPHYQQQFQQQPGMYGMHDPMSKPIMMGSSGTQNHEMTFGHNLGQQAYFEVA
ncbi:hypothetical protein CVT26_002635 [Gymnopilus dilepis]|uniref:HMG box domain-containing protein n=1 Tax=Gymnopilus dilepis TaxID=231916 RepID=A0A409VCI1_9AGAR|nr:hypothetical protein CVT26_002635 [Gymnopilus dilepis]